MKLFAKPCFLAISTINQYVELIVHLFLAKSHRHQYALVVPNSEAFDIS